MTSLQPFCIASSNGVVYGVSFAYDLSTISTSPYPDFVVLLKGSTATGLRQDMNWTVMSSTLRTTVGIFPEPLFPYTHVCGVSHDGSLFMLHSLGPGQQFSVQIPTEKYSAVLVLPDVYQNDSVTNEVSSWTSGPSLVMPTIDFISENATMQASEEGDWMHLSTLQQSSLVIARSNGSFPSTPQRIFNGIFQEVGLGIAYANKELYLLSTSANGQSANVRSIPFEYNATNPNWFNTNSTRVDLSAMGVCTPTYSAIAVKDNFVYVVCSQSYDNPSQTTFSIINTQSASNQSFPMTIPATFNYKTSAISALRLAPITPSTFLFSDGTNLFWIDTTSGKLAIDLYTIDPMKRFTSNNQNPDMTSKPLTFSGTYTFAIVVVCLVVAALLVWAQRLFFKWRAGKWVDDSDIPGSKVAEEAQDQSHNQNSSGLQSPTSLYVPPSYSEADITRNNSHTSMTPLSSAGHGSPGLRADELEMMPFSTHPRPNVVTTISDRSSEDTHTPRE